MTAVEPDFASWVEGLRFEPGGMRLELEPWQTAMLRDLQAGRKPLTVRELELAGRRSGRRMRAAYVLAAAALGDHDVITFGDETVIALARRILVDYGRTLDVDVQAALARLSRIPRPAPTFAVIDEAIRHAPGDLERLTQNVPAARRRRQHP